jgi:hypothetical protein
MSVLNGHTPFTRNPDFIVFGVSVFDVHWFTVDGMSYTCIVIVFHDEFLPMRQTHLTSPRAAVWSGKHSNTAPFSLERSSTYTENVYDHCPIQAM